MTAARHRKRRLDLFPSQNQGGHLCPSQESDTSQGSQGLAFPKPQPRRGARSHRALPFSHLGRHSRGEAASAPVTPSPASLLSGPPSPARPPPSTLHPACQPLSSEPAKDFRALTLCLRTFSGYLSCPPTPSLPSAQASLCLGTSVPALWPAAVSLALHLCRRPWLPVSGLPVWPEQQLRADGRGTPAEAHPQLPQLPCATHAARWPSSRHRPTGLAGAQTSPATQTSRGWRTRPWPLQREAGRNRRWPPSTRPRASCRTKPPETLGGYRPQHQRTVTHGAGTHRSARSGALPHTVLLEAAPPTRAPRSARVRWTRDTCDGL